MQLALNGPCYLYKSIDFSSSLPVPEYDFPTSLQYIKKTRKYIYKILSGVITPFTPIAPSKGNLHTPGREYVPLVETR